MNLEPRDRTEVEEMEKQPLLNTYVNNLTMEQTVEEIKELLIIGQPTYVVPINVDVVVQIENDSYLKRIIDDANLTLVDGQPLVWISRWYNRPVKEKVSGSDLVPHVCNMAAYCGYSIFLIGGKEGIAKRAKKNLEYQFPNIKVVGTYSPPFGFEKDKEEIVKINKRIQMVHPDIVVACFGCPKQEKWVYENYRKYGAPLTICAGATVDFIAGNVARAPLWMRNCGLEWFYRFLKEPRRLFRRYFIDDIKILVMAFKYWVKR